MAADPELTAETRAWLTKSANDLRAVLDPTLLEIVDHAAPLTEYAWRFRYPGAPEGIDAEEAGEALKAARLVHDAIVSRVPPEVRP
ncbi:MAG: HEPN domain-containing protein [Bryobacteraceae bacterium]|jgi:hypothetical protein